MQMFLSPTQEEIMRAAIDISKPRLQVEVKYSEDGDKMWVNVDGVCILRIQQMGEGVLVRHDNGGTNGKP